MSNTLKYIQLTDGTTLALDSASTGLTIKNDTARYSISVSNGEYNYEYDEAYITIGNDTATGCIICSIPMYRDIFIDIGGLFDTYSLTTLVTDVPFMIVNNYELFQGTYDVTISATLGMTSSTYDVYINCSIDNVVGNYISFPYEATSSIYTSQIVSGKEYLTLDSSYTFRLVVSCTAFIL